MLQLKYRQHIIKYIGKILTTEETVMPDMLVKLYELPDTTALYKKLEDQGIRIIIGKTKLHCPESRRITQKFLG